LVGDPAHDRLVNVRLVHGANVLQDRGRALDAHARVDGLLRQRRQLAVGMPLELHEHERPELHETPAASEARLAVRLAATVPIAPSLKYWPNEKLPCISKKVRWEPSRPTSSMSGVRKHF